MLAFNFQTHQPLLFPYPEHVPTAIALGLPPPVEKVQSDLFCCIVMTLQHFGVCTDSQPSLWTEQNSAVISTNVRHSTALRERQLECDLIAGLHTFKGNLLSKLWYSCAEMFQLGWIWVTFAISTQQNRPIPIGIGSRRRHECMHDTQKNGARESRHLRDAEVATWIAF